MRSLIFTFTLTLLICSNCISPDHKKEAATALQKIEYIPFYHDNNGSFMMVDGVVNDSIKVALQIDSGLTGCDMIVDSAFFFQTFDINNFTHQKSPFKLRFYRETYEGEFSVRVGDHKFSVNIVNVENILQHPASKQDRIICGGILGSRLFEDKITLIDYEKRRLAFVDSIEIDRSYARVEFKPSRTDSVIGKQKYVEVSGFKDKSGNDIPTRFLFDLGNVVSAIAIKNEIGVNMSNPLHNKTSSYAIGHWRHNLEQVKGMVDSLQIGPFYLKKPTVSYCAEGSFLDPISQMTGSDGLLGLAFWVRFNLIVDYKNNLLYLKPNAYFHTGAPYKWNAYKDSIYLKNRVL